MLIQNPQLAYALLQAQVVMRIIEPATAVVSDLSFIFDHFTFYFFLNYLFFQTFLFKPNTMPPVLTTQSTTQSVQSMMNTTLASMGQPPLNMPTIATPFGQDTDLRSADPRLNRATQQHSSASMDMDMRSMSMPNQIQIPMAFDQRPAQTAPSVATRQFPADPRQRASETRDPRQKAQQSTNLLAAQIHRGIQNDASDQEKAQLIMQVLKLTDEQIAILPQEQRASILVLKEQIAKSANLK
jgi:cleavage stimulation factor subunit 2